MLNPFAHEFSPTAFIPETKVITTHDSNKKNTRKPKERKEAVVAAVDLESNNKGTITKGKEVARKTQTKDTNNKNKSKDNKSNKSNDNNTKSKENKSGNKEAKGKEPKNKDTKGKDTTRKKRDSIQSTAPSNNNTRKKSVPTATVIPPNEFEQESPFIAIEAAIDPVHRIDNIVNTSDNRRKQSLTHDTKKQYEHGYERYINWIDRSLQMYGIVTVVGMDKAIVDVVSLVTILQDRKIGEHQDIETFTMNQGNKPTSCIQVKLHPYYLYK